MISDRLVRTNGVDICVETFGSKEDPAILLIHGATASMLAWEDDFCRQLASAGRFVIRFDHRDTGRSVSYEPGAPLYSLRDLMEDAIGLVDAFGIGRAHLLGRSMGGGIALLAALDHPDRVASLTLMATSPGGSDLSPPSAEFLAHTQANVPPDWSDRQAVIDHIVSLLRVFDGGTSYFDEAAVRERTARDVDRTINVASSQTNHFLIDLGAPIRPRLPEVDVPTLVIHGEMDPVIRLDHANALAAEIPDARLLVLPETGHLVLPHSWDRIIPAIVSHTEAA